MSSESHERTIRRETHSIPPLSSDAPVDRESHAPWSDGGDSAFIRLDARAVTSIAAIVFALMGVLAIALIGYMAHPPQPVGHAAPHALGAPAAPTPLVNFGREIPTPAINLPQHVAQSTPMPAQPDSMIEGGAL
jgi:hypothetical protein